MRIAGLKILIDFGKKHADIRSQINAWISEVEEATWQKPQDVKDRYVHASFLANNRVIFNLKGNHYRLDTKINYKNQVVLVIRIGTHSDYSKWKF